MNLTLSKTSFERPPWIPGLRFASSTSYCQAKLVLIREGGERKEGGKGKKEGREEKEERKEGDKGGEEKFRK